MEAARLTGPPHWLERIVFLAIPPAAREEVAGDLWETYCGPRQYAAEALRTVPFVIASQARRNLNLPAILLQAALIFIFLGGPVTLILLPALAVHGAYQQTARPCPRRAMREAILLSSGMMVLLLLIMSVWFPLAGRPGLDHFTWLNLFLLSLLLSPFLCLFRAGLILQGDRYMPACPGALQKEDLARNYRQFQHAIVRRNLLEASALAAVAVAGLFFAWSGLLTGLFLLAALYLLVDAAPRAFPAMDDFMSLRARYRQNLARQQQLRRFLCWLWVSPVLVTLHARLVAEHSLAAGRPITAMLACVAAVILCFLAAALNREYGGRIQENIGLLDRVREKVSQA
ncbi:MAG TPA: hypothetical protein VJM78_08705 [Rhizomicrobium sp.]|nr:hypothetical protein [Rhizomicrobium sp.]